MKKTMFAATALCAVLAICGCGGKTTPPNPEPAPEPVLPQYDIREGHFDMDANADFSVKTVQKRENSPLEGKLFYFLGSSVTYGAASDGESLADFLAALTGCTCVKEAVSGTTIFDDGKTDNTGTKSYTRRLTQSTAFDRSAHPDAFICQISTNDATNDRLGMRGEISEGIPAAEEYDRATTLGGVEFILRYVTDTWGCPVYFYSGAYFGDEGSRKNANPKGSEYGKLVAQVNDVVKKWQAAGYDVDVIDLYNDEAFNGAVTDEYYKWCTSDPIHPKKAGYLNWWTPYFEAFLINRLK